LALSIDLGSLTRLSHAIIYTHRVFQQWRASLTFFELSRRLKELLESYLAYVVGRTCCWDARHCPYTLK
jgi:hypothetical protein